MDDCLEEDDENGGSVDDENTEDVEERFLLLLPDDLLVLPQLKRGRKAIVYCCSTVSDLKREKDLTAIY